MLILNVRLSKFNKMLILFNGHSYPCEARDASASGKVDGHPMTRDELEELGYIVPIDTVPSILQHGILSHRRAQKLAHEDISLAQVQDFRSKVVVPSPDGGRLLHDYVNLYICARNPMLLKKSSIHHKICVLRVSAAVLDIPGTVVTDSNAGSKYVKFSPAPNGLSIVNRSRTFADWWTHLDDQIDEWRHSAQKCAEVLVPNVVAATHITGACVCSEASQGSLQSVAPTLAVIVNKHLFFK